MIGSFNGQSATSKRFYFVVTLGLCVIRSSLNYCRRKQRSSYSKRDVILTSSVSDIAKLRGKSVTKTIFIQIEISLPQILICHSKSYFINILIDLRKVSRLTIVPASSHIQDVNKCCFYIFILKKKTKS